MQMMQQGGQGAGMGASIGGGYGAIIGGAAGLAQGAIMPTSEQQQLEQQEKLNAMNMRYNIGMMNAQKASQLDMWNKTNYEAQIEHMKKAGLNPGLMYGMSGGGGTTTGNAGGGNFQSQAGQDVQRDQIGLMRASQQIQLGLMEAQKENIEADTKLKGVTADKTSGVDTEKVEAEIGLVSAQTKNTEAEGLGIAYDNLIKEIDYIVKGGTVPEQIDKIRAELNYAQWMVKKLEQEVPLAGKTAQAQLDNLNKDIEVKEQDIKESDAKITKMKQDINIELQKINQANVFNLRDYRLQVQNIQNDQIRNATYEAMYELEKEYKEKNLQWDKDRFTAELGGKIFAKMAGMKSPGKVTDVPNTNHPKPTYKPAGGYR